MARSALSRDRIGTVHAQDRPDARPIGFGAPGVGATGVERSTAETDPAVDDQAPIAVTGVAGGGVMVTVGAAGLVAPSHPVMAIMANARMRDPKEACIAPNLFIRVAFPGVNILQLDPRKWGRGAESVLLPKARGRYSPLMRVSTEARAASARATGAKADGAPGAILVTFASPDSNPDATRIRNWSRKWP